jgi:hypothetical protein
MVDSHPVLRINPVLPPCVASTGQLLGLAGCALSYGAVSLPVARRDGMLKTGRNTNNPQEEPS